MIRTSSSLSSLVVIVFLVTLFFMVVTINLYQDSRSNNSLSNVDDRIFDSKREETLETLKIKNYQGSLKFQKAFYEWKIIEPASIIIDQSKFKRFLKSLSHLKVKKFLKNDLINRANYSIDTPLTEIELNFQNQSGEKLLFGLQNSIDQSCYLSKSGRNQILQAKDCDSRLMTYGISDFITYYPFSFNLDQLQALHLTRQAKSILNISKGSSLGWIDQRNRIISDGELSRLFEDLSNIKSFYILRQPSVEQTNVIENAFKKPSFSFSIGFKDQQKIEYVVSSPLKKLTGFDFPRWSASIVKRKDSDSFYLVKNRDLKPLKLRVKSPQSGVMRLSY